MHLDFQGTRAEGLLLTLLLGASAVLCAQGLWCFRRGRRRAGVLSLLAAGGPVLAAVGLILDAAWRFWKEDTSQARRSLLAGIFAAVLSGVVGVVWERSGVGGAFWLALTFAHVATATGLLYASTYRALGGGRFGVLLLMRLLAVVSLLLILFKPVLVIPAPADENKPALVVLLDRSGSMAAQDAPDAPSRHGKAAEMLLSQARRLGDAFDVRWFDFAAAPAAARSAEDLARRGTTGPGTDATDIAAALQQAGQTSPAAGVLLLSDGVNNTRSDPAATASSLHVPVYAVAVGSTEETAVGRANLQLLRVDAPLQAAVDHATDIAAQVRMTRLANTQAQVQLLEGDSETPIAAEMISAASHDVTRTAKFTWTPRKDSPAGIAPLRVRILPHLAESLADDNEITFHVAIRSPAIRVLYIEGAVRPEYKYLQRLLQSDPNVQFAGLVRISGNRFWSQGRLDGATLTHLPTSDEDFRRFDVLILGDLDASFLGAERMDRIRRFVADGGGLVMLGGQSSFGPGGYERTEVEAALPVVVGGRNQPQVKDAFVPQLTPAGAEHPIFAGIAGYFSHEGGEAAEVSLPALQGCVSVVRAKPAAAVLAVHPTQRNEAGPLIVLAVEPFGAGRSAALTADTTWRWFLLLPLRAKGVNSPYARFWGQLIRWLAGAETVARREGALVLLRAERTYTRAGEAPITLQALVRKADGTPAGEAKVSVACLPAAALGEQNQKTNSTSIELQATELPGIFEGKIAPADAGDFLLRVSATDETGVALGTDELPLKVLPTSGERDQTARHDALLHAIADSSKGQFVELSALPNLLDSLIARQQRQAGPPPGDTVKPLYHFPAMFVAFVLLLTAEWILRRRWQLR